MHVSRTISNQNQSSIPAPTLPEKELLLAILDRSVMDYHSKNSRLSKAASEWLFDEQDHCSTHAFSFNWICEYLSIDKQSLRGSITELDLSAKPPQGQRWLRKKVKRVSPPKGNGSVQRAANANDELRAA